MTDGQRIWLRNALYIAGVLLIAWLASPLIARAQQRDFLQQWIHTNAKDCCPHDRCFPVIAAPGERHWNVMGYKTAPRLGHERRWPFDRTYGCAYPSSPEVIRCLFVPAPEAS